MRDSRAVCHPTIFFLANLVDFFDKKIALKRLRENFPVQIDFFEFSLQSDNELLVSN